MHITVSLLLERGHWENWQAPCRTSPVAAEVGVIICFRKARTIIFARSSDAVAFPGGSPMALGNPDCISWR